MANTLTLLFCIPLFLSYIPFLIFFYIWFQSGVGLLQCVVSFIFLSIYVIFLWILLVVLFTVDLSFSHPVLTSIFFSFSFRGFPVILRSCSYLIPVFCSLCLSLIFPTIVPPLAFLCPRDTCSVSFPSALPLSGLLWVVFLYISPVSGCIYVFLPQVSAFSGPLLPYVFLL